MNISMTPIRIFVCDDHDILRKGLRSLLSTEADLEFLEKPAARMKRLLK